MKVCGLCLIVGRLLSPLDLCNTPTKKYPQGVKVRGLSATSITHISLLWGFEIYADKDQHTTRYV